MTPSSLSLGDPLCLVYSTFAWDLATHNLVERSFSFVDDWCGTLRVVLLEVRAPEPLLATSSECPLWPPLSLSLPLTWLELHGMQRRPEVVGPAIRPSDKTASQLCQLGSLTAFRGFQRPWGMQSSDQTAHVHLDPERPSWGLNYTLTESHVKTNHKLRSTFYSFNYKIVLPHPWHKMLSFFFCYYILYLFEYIQYDF